MVKRFGESQRFHMSPVRMDPTRLRLDSPVRGKTLLMRMSTWERKEHQAKDEVGASSLRPFVDKEQ